MPLLKYPVKICVITMADAKDIKHLEDELRAHGELKGRVFKEEGGIKGGAYLWKHRRRFKPDEFILVIIGGKKSFIEGKISNKGLLNLKQFNMDYPKIPIHDIGLEIGAKEVADTADYKFKEKPKDLPRGIMTRRLKIGCLIHTIDKDYETFREELTKHVGEKELFADRFAKEDVGLIIWHREKPGFDEYWIFLTLDKDIGLDMEGPNINEFIKNYGKKIPIISVGLLKTEFALDPSRITKKLEKKFKEIKKIEIKKILNMPKIKI